MKGLSDKSACCGEGRGVGHVVMLFVVNHRNTHVYSLAQELIRTVGFLSYPVHPYSRHLGGVQLFGVSGCCGEGGSVRSVFVMS